MLYSEQLKTKYENIRQILHIVFSVIREYISKDSTDALGTQRANVLYGTLNNIYLSNPISCIHFLADYLSNDVKYCSSVPESEAELLNSENLLKGQISQLVITHFQYYGQIPEHEICAKLTAEFEELKMIACKASLEKNSARKIQHVWSDYRDEMDYKGTYGVRDLAKIIGEQLTVNSIREISEGDILVMAFSNEERPTRHANICYIKTITPENVILDTFELLYFNLFSRKNGDKVYGSIGLKNKRDRAYSIGFRIETISLQFFFEKYEHIAAIRGIYRLTVPVDILKMHDYIREVADSINEKRRWGKYYNCNHVIYHVLLKIIHNTSSSVEKPPIPSLVSSRKRCPLLPHLGGTPYLDKFRLRNGLVNFETLETGRCKTNREHKPAQCRVTNVEINGANAGLPNLYFQVALYEIGVFDILNAFRESPRQVPGPKAYMIINDLLRALTSMPENIRLIRLPYIVDRKAKLGFLNAILNDPVLKTSLCLQLNNLEMFYRGSYTVKDDNGRYIVKEYGTSHFPLKLEGTGSSFYLFKEFLTESSLGKMVYNLTRVLGLEITGVALYLYVAEITPLTTSSAGIIPFSKISSVVNPERPQTTRLSQEISWHKRYNPPVDCEANTLTEQRCAYSASTPVAPPVISGSTYSSEMLMDSNKGLCSRNAHLTFAATDTELMIEGYRLKGFYINADISLRPSRGFKS